MPMIHHVVQVIADNTDVFNDTLGADLPDWARRVRVQVIAPDSDWTFDLVISGDELARSCGPSINQADNLQDFDWTKPHFQWDVDRARGARSWDVLLNVDVVTAGVGKAIIQYES